MRAMAARLPAILVCMACVACGRLGFEGIDDHLHVAEGWSIEPLVDLTPFFTYKQCEYQEVSFGCLDNAPIYVTALYPPFKEGLAVLAGRSVIALPNEGAANEHSFEPPVSDDEGPDVLGRATFAVVGNEDGLWLTSTTTEGGDGLYLIKDDWSIDRLDDTNNTLAIGWDIAGSYDNVGGPALYVIREKKRPERRTEMDTEILEWGVLNAMGDRIEIRDLAVMENRLFVTVMDYSAGNVQLMRLGPRPSYHTDHLTTTKNLTLVEGSTEAGLFGIQDDDALVKINPGTGEPVRTAWTDDDNWVWKSVCAPRTDHQLAGHLIVLESNRMRNQDRLLLVTPP
jgi:hypothetical protein